MIRLNGTDFVTINNLNVNAYSTSTSNYGWGVFMTNDADNNTINGCTITLDSNTTSSNYAGIVLSGSPTTATTTGSNCDNITLTNNTINGGYYGITLMGNTGAGIIQNIVVANNVVKNFYIYGIYGGGTNNSVIENNDIHRMTRSSNFTTFYGINMGTANTALTISRNRIHDPATVAPASSFTLYGIYLSASTSTVGNENMVANNLLYSLQGEGSQYALYNSSSGNTRYYYNTINSDYAATTGGLTRGFYQITAQTGIELRNNIISITRSTGSTANRPRAPTAAPSRSDASRTRPCSGSAPT
ncbi:MAG: hypothetical protein EOP49_53435 [Sphingobacteriales bacterium]|nr:MAG: hypothetical protein EOP49_53435 [Sphingobacteriales bacterium]